MQQVQHVPDPTGFQQMHIPAQGCRVKETHRCFHDRLNERLVNVFARAHSAGSGHLCNKYRQHLNQSHLPLHRTTVWSQRGNTEEETEETQ